MDLDIDVATSNGFTVLSPRGDIDYATAGHVQDAITETLLAGDVSVVVDLRGVDFIESTGLGVLIGGRRRALALKGSLSLVCVEEPVLTVFRVTGLDKVFSIYPTVEDAVAA
jgi:anti-sigma B factor antagonist